MTSHIPRDTRLDVLDWLRVEGVAWSGRLAEETFLDRVTDLDSLPSTDPRFSSARGDIIQHRHNNDDWDSDWVYSYAPLSLLDGPDEVFAKFLTEVLHPIVRPDSDEARQLAAELNDLLAQSGFELFEARRIGARPVWGIREVGTGATGNIAEPTANTEAITRIWGPPAALRLFLSHVSAHKIEVSALRSSLQTYGVSAFVAHEDIEPTLDWLSEIQVALTTCHAAAALLTSEFHASNWTDQEMGIAIGRGALVLAIQLPSAPYGFLGKQQGLRGNLSEPGALAIAIVDVLLKRTETALLMREALTAALESSNSYRMTNTLVARIAGTTGFTRAQLQRMKAATTANDQVHDAYSLAQLNQFLAEQT